MTLLPQMPPTHMGFLCCELMKKKMFFPPETSECTTIHDDVHMKNIKEKGGGWHPSYQPSPLFDKIFPISNNFEKAE